MSNEKILAEIESSDFEFAQKDERIHDLKFDTKPIGYFKDAWLRFRKSKASIVGAIVIILIVLYALITPLVSRSRRWTSHTRRRLRACPLRR